MVGAAKKAASTKPDGEKATRKMPTQAERIAALEQKLADARAKGEAKANKAKAAAVTKRDALVAKRDKLNAEIDKLNATIGDDVTDVVTDGVGDPPEVDES